MKVSKKSKVELVDRFENAFDYIKVFDKFPFCLKREAAVIAANAAVEYLEKEALT